MSSFYGSIAEEFYFWSFLAMKSYYPLLASASSLQNIPVTPAFMVMLTGKEENIWGSLYQHPALSKTLTVIYSVGRNLMDEEMHKLEM